jgi:hypothetical protein
MRLLINSTSFFKPSLVANSCYSCNCFNSSRTLFVLSSIAALSFFCTESIFQLRVFNVSLRDLSRDIMYCFSIRSDYSRAICLIVSLENMGKVASVTCLNKEWRLRCSERLRWWKRMTYKRWHLSLLHV